MKALACLALLIGVIFPVCAGQMSKVSLVLRSDKTDVTTATSIFVLNEKDTEGKEAGPMWSLSRQILSVLGDGHVNWSYMVDFGDGYRLTNYYFSGISDSFFTEYGVGFDEYLRRFEANFGSSAASSL